MMEDVDRDWGLRGRHYPRGKEMKTEVKIDPELLRQLDAVSTDAELVEAVFSLRPEEPSQLVTPPERTAELAQEVLERVQEQVGDSAAQTNVFVRLGSFAVSARPAFLRKLLAQPEIASAMANRQPGEALIQPKGKRPIPFSKGKSAGFKKGRP